MEKVVDSVRRVTDIMAEISSASREQTSGIEQINGAIGEMDAMTQQNTALVEEASAAAQEMHDQAAALAAVVGLFKVNCGSDPGSSFRGSDLNTSAVGVGVVPRTALPLYQ
jgi:methyl-accepting chemotaxis protein